MESIRKAPLYSKVCWFVSRKSICMILDELGTELGPFFMKCQIYLKECLTGKLCLFKCECMSDFFFFFK